MENVSVAISGGAKADTDYMAMIHYETNGNGKPDGTPYAIKFKIRK